jgi:hypothetical protein
MFGIDYTTPGGLNIPAAHKAGIKFVCRYTAPDTASYRWKRATVSEAKKLKLGAIQLVLVFETSAQRALAGHAAGVQDAKTALAHAKQLGLSPKGAGVYGGYWVVKRALDAGACAGAWQTYAWSGGALDKRAHLYQYSNGHNIAGVSADYDKSLKPNYADFIYFAVDFDAAPGSQAAINAYLKGASSVLGKPKPKKKGRKYRIAATNEQGQTKTVVTSWPWVVGHLRFRAGKFHLAHATITEIKK